MAHPPNKIFLIGEEDRHDEAIAAGTIKPGHLIKLDTAGKVVVHATANGDGENLFAKEDSLQGKTIDDAYSADDLVQYGIAESGDVLLGRLKAGENVAKGDQLLSGGDGSMIKTTGTVKKTFAVALDALDLSGMGAVESFLRMRIL